MKSDKAKSIRFNLAPYIKDLAHKDWKTIRFVEKNITGICFSPIINEKVFSIEKLDTILCEFYENCKTSVRYIIAYKGGCVEKRKLDALRIPNVNLELFGCPKFNDLRTENDRHLSCGYHKNNLHCPREEVSVFKKWILEKLKIQVQ